MAQPAYPEASLLGIPLEIRHIIFEHASARDIKPKKLFRYWFEKKEAKEIIALQAANNPTGPTARVVYSDGYEEDSELEVDPNQLDNEDDNDDDDDDDDEQDDIQDDEDEDEEHDEQDQDGNEDEAENDEEMSDAGNEEVEAAAEIAGENEQTGADTASGEASETMTESNGEGAEAGRAQVDEEMPDSPGAEIQADPTSGEAPANTASGENEEEQGEAEEEMHDSENEDVEGDQDAEGEDDEGMADQTDIAVAAAAAQTTPPPPPAPVITPHRKWRHIPKFVRITQCPPPVELFLICKQLNAEARDWFYKVAVLNIDATASFSHFSFFEVALGMIAEAAFSPMENIRKAEVTFVWDTTWIRAESTGYAANVFEFFLQTRADYVLKILQQASDLEQVVIHWHDSANDVEAQALMQETLEKFVCNLQATIDTRAHIIASDAKPHAKSIAGKRRLEFQGIVDNPPEAF